MYALLSERLSLFTFPNSVQDLGFTIDSSLTCAECISKLTFSTYFQLRHLIVIRKSVSLFTFTSIVHALICSSTDYSNSLLIGLTIVHLAPLQSVCLMLLLAWYNVAHVP